MSDIYKKDILLKQNMNQAAPEEIPMKEEDSAAAVQNHQAGQQEASVQSIHIREASEHAQAHIHHGQHEHHGPAGQGNSTGNSVRKAHHSYAAKSQMVTRMNRIEGQIRGIKKMIENDIYCDDILHQFMSVESAIHGVKTQLLEAHMKSCVVHQIQDGETAVIDELLQTIKKMSK